jgi:hypothetical protein
MVVMLKAADVAEAGGVVIEPAPSLTHAQEEIAETEATEEEAGE